MSVGKPIVTVTCDNEDCLARVEVQLDSRAWNIGVERAVVERNNWVRVGGSQFCCMACLKNAVGESGKESSNAKMESKTA